VREERGSRVRDRLAGKSILLTGATGFVGKAVLAVLLRNAPDFRRLVVVLRADSDDLARRRLVEEVLPADAFAGLAPTEVLAEVESGRIQAAGARLEREPGPAAASTKTWAHVDTVIHCAATVSFEEPLDDALTLNSLGPVRLLERLLAAGSRPHFVHVSTAYVADRQSGEVLEDGLVHHAIGALDPERLLAEGRERRAAEEQASREGSRRGEFAREARRDASRRPGIDADERAEQLRLRWLARRLSEFGHRRANELGWPDTYALSKALGERLLCERSPRTTVIRPTIVESALHHPYPGWLEGIKVADPLILAYAGRGLTHLPGRRPNTIDIVPVDHVANACVVAAANPPRDPRRNLAVASSARNPLAIGELADQIKRYFRREPLIHRNGSPIEIGELRFVDRDVAMRRTMRRERLAAALAGLATSSPVRLPQERMLRGNRALAERVTRMVRIYGAYTELDCVFDDTNARALGGMLAADDRAALSFDTAEIDWDDYLQRVHLPQVRRLAAEG
jgi:alcohol-forming fatty acyl-CoA reductase